MVVQCETGAQKYMDGLQKVALASMHTSRYNTYTCGPTVGVNTVTELCKRLCAIPWGHNCTLQCMPTSISNSMLILSGAVGKVVMCLFPLHSKTSCKNLTNGSNIKVPLSNVHLLTTCEHNAAAAVSLQGCAWHQSLSEPLEVLLVMLVPD